MSADCCESTGQSHPARCKDCAVRPFSVCAALSDDELGELQALSEPTSVAPKSALLLQDEPIQNVFNITSGCVRLSKILSDGRRQVIGFAIAGDFLGLSFQDRSNFTAEAIGPVTACRFRKKAFLNYLDTKPDLVRRLLEFSANELRLAQEQLVLLGRRTAEERVASFLTMLRARNSRFGHQGATLQLPMSRLDIADYLGLTIETVSRTFTKMVRDKLIIIVPDGIRFVDLAHVGQIAAE